MRSDHASPTHRCLRLHVGFPAVKDIRPDLADLARDLARLADSTDNPISRRLLEMADEVLALADRESADPAVYHSDTIFMHTEGPKTGPDPYANDSSTLPTHRN
jgi:hypothetical protein